MSTARERHPELFQPPSRESARGKKKTVPLECLSLGFYRTGTASMSTALEILGLHTWHSLLFYSTNLGDCEMWQELLERKFTDKEELGRDDFDQLFHNFGAVAADSPAIAFSEELIKLYPEAKIVLVERNIDSWYESVDEAIFQMMTRNPVLNALAHIAIRWGRVLWTFMYLNPSFVGLIGWTHAKCMHLWWGAYNVEQTRKVAKSKYREHYAMVRRVTPKDRLLEFQLDDGWEPLCKFLGKPVPDQPFPHVNEREWLLEKVNLMIQLAAKRLLKKVALFGTPLLIVVLGFLWHNQ